MSVEGLQRVLLPLRGPHLGLHQLDDPLGIEARCPLAADARQAVVQELGGDVEEEEAAVLLLPQAVADHEQDVLQEEAARLAPRPEVLVVQQGGGIAIIGAIGPATPAGGQHERLLKQLVELLLVLQVLPLPAQLRGLVHPAHDLLALPAVKCKARGVLVVKLHEALELPPQDARQRAVPGRRRWRVWDHAHGAAVGCSGKCDLAVTVVVMVAVLVRGVVEAADAAAAPAADVAVVACRAPQRRGDGRDGRDGGGAGAVPVLPSRREAAWHTAVPTPGVRAVEDRIMSTSFQFSDLLPLPSHSLSLLTRRPPPAARRR